MSGKIRIDRLLDSSMDFKTAIASFLSYNRSRNLSVRTIEYYDCCLLSFTRYLSVKAPGIKPAEITAGVIRDFITDQMERNSASTACHCHTTLSVFFNYLVNEGYVLNSPMVSVLKPKRKKAIIETFTLEQIEALLGVCGANFQGLRDSTMILTMVDCGLRASELVGLELDDVLASQQLVRVLGKGNKERMVPYGNTVKSALSRYLTRRGKLLTSRVFVNCYGEPLTRYSVREIIYRRGKEAVITGVRCSPHTFRHTFAVTYLRNGGDVFSLQKLLGHSDLAMTRRYCELSESDVQEKHRLYSPADRLKEAGRTGRKRLK